TSCISCSSGASPPARHSSGSQRRLKSFVPSTPRSRDTTSAVCSQAFHMPAIAVQGAISCSTYSEDGEEVPSAGTGSAVSGAAALGRAGPGSLGLAGGWEGCADFVMWSNSHEGGTCERHRLAARASVRVRLHLLPDQHGTSLPAILVAPVGCRGDRQH